MHIATFSLIRNTNFRLHEQPLDHFGPSTPQNRLRCPAWCAFPYCKASRHGCSKMQNCCHFLHPVGSAFFHSIITYDQTGATIVYKFTCELTAHSNRPIFYLYSIYILSIFYPIFYPIFELPLSAFWCGRAVLIK